MKVGIVLPAGESFSPLNGGPLPWIVFETYRYLKEEYDMTIFCQPSSRHWTKDIASQIMYTPFIRRVPIIRKYWARLYPREVALRMGDRYEVAWIHNRLVYAPIIKRLNPSTKIVLHMHNNHLADIDEVLFNKVLASVDLVVTVSEFIKQGIVERCPRAESKVRVVLNGVNTERFVPLANGHSQKDSNVLFVGRLVEMKGLHILIEAMERVISALPQSKFIIVGSSWFGVDSETPYIKRLKQQAAKLGENVVFTGYVEADELPLVYQKAAVFVAPYLWGDFVMLTNLEAMASGLAVVAFKKGGPLEDIGDAGIPVDLGDVDSLSDSIIRLLKDDQLRAHLGHKARKRVEQQFTWERVASEFRAILKELE